MDDGNIEFFGRIDHQVKIKGFRIEVGEIENRLSRHPDIKEAIVITMEDEKESKYLSAYITCRNKIELSQIREYLKKHLPYYMIPSHFILLESIPLTPNGKIDRKALPPTEGYSGIGLRENVAYSPPSTAAAKKLVEIWEKVLGRRNIGINENFFQMGGDSIKSIQIISRMATAGYKLEMKDLFQYPVISELAPRITKLKRIPDQSVITGIVPLTPIQKMFFARSHSQLNHYNQAVLLYSKEGFAKEAINEIFSKIQEHHDALRMTYQINPANGKVDQTSHGLGYPLSLAEYDLKGGESSLDEFNMKVNEIQAGIDLEKGPLMKLALFHLEDGDRLLIVIHHLAIDGVSWRILFEDIETLYDQYKQGEKLVLPLKTDSFKHWSEKLSAYANSKNFLKDINYWQKIESDEAPLIPTDFEINNNDIKDTGSVSFILSEDETEALLTKVNDPFGTEINEILLTTLGMGIKHTFGHDRVLIALESHGREEILGGLDISRTVGWFTSFYPVLLDVFYSDDPDRQIKEIKEILRKIPHKGIGYGILKYLTHEENKKGIEFKLKPQISFNYLGQFDADIKQKSFFEIAKESPGNMQCLDNRKESLLEVSGMIANNQLTMNVSYNKTQFNAETVKLFAEKFKAELVNIIAFCCVKTGTVRTPSDFTYKGMSIERLDQLMKEYPGIEDIYTLTPMQEGMLFYALADDKSYAYFQQMSYRLQGELNICLVEKSLNELFKRHHILRTAFVYKDINRPVQIVLKDRVVDLYYEDISQLETGEVKEAFISEFKEKDKKRSFDLDKDVLMRISILQLEGREYEVIWSHHHLLMDGWCIGILNNEFYEIYSGYSENKPHCLSPVKPYQTYIQWLEKQDKEDSALYWTAYLDSFEEQTGVPRTRSLMKEGTENRYRNGKVSVILDMEKTTGLNKLAAGNHVTLNIVVQTLWGILLGIYTAKEDVIFGSVVSGRPSGLKGVESIVGLFINTIPVRIQFEEKIKFNRLVQQIQWEALASEPHHYHSLAEIQSLSKLKQNLIDHLFIFENYPIVEQIEEHEVKGNNSNNVTFELANVEVFEQTNYDFNIIISGSDRLIIKFAYNGNVYAREYVERIAGHFQVAIDMVIKDETLVTRDLALLTEAERNQILYDFNDTGAEYPKDKTIHQLFAEQVEKTSDSIAVFGHGRTLSWTNTDNNVGADLCVYPARGIACPANLSYRHLNEQSDRLAGLLIQKGVLPDTIVGIMMERSLEMIIGIMGILKSGGVYLPIDPEYPQERIDYMLKDSAAKYLAVANDKEGEKMRRWEGETVLLESIIYDLNHLKDRPRRGLHHSSFINQHSNQLAYIIYTSGSTGKPKGVVVEHRNIVNTLNWFVNMHRIGSDTHIIQLSAYTFDASVNQIFGALIAGASLYIAVKEDRTDMERLRNFIIYHRINIINSVPTLIKELFRYGGKLESLHTIISGAEKLDEITKEVILEKGYRLVNQYGPTEATIDSLALECSQEKVSLGKPIYNVQIYILDKYEKVLPIGIVGELHIRGAGVARGYLNNPELTNDRFIFTKVAFEKAPVGTAPPKLLIINHSPLYKTGDLAHWLPDGNIEFLGRIDHQVKIRGFRIELQEIEEQLLKCPGISRGVVIDREIGVGKKSLCAYLESKKELDVTELKRILSKILPEYMIPSYFIRIEKIPLTANGKIDRKVLNSIGVEQISREEYVTPRNEIEKKIVEIWKEVLGLEKIGVSENFFDIGGTSLDIIRLNVKFKEIFNEEETFVQMFRFPTIRSFGEYLMQKRDGTIFNSKTNRSVPIDKMKQTRKNQKTKRQKGGILI
ncbi:MAG: amino acid adenylation domain-containing protein [Acidobacteria bacterium]|nr:amino acid adenylation domain-containing protein [Acidobacteriota bacterium]